jgi:hypothetical protein
MSGEVWGKYPAGEGVFDHCAGGQGQLGGFLGVFRAFL